MGTITHDNIFFQVSLWLLGVSSRGLLQFLNLTPVRNAQPVSAGSNLVTASST